MKILALDSSAVAASAAIVEDGKILGENYINVGLTHSQTLLPMLKSLLQCSGLTIKDIDLLSITNGPGSFTGVRIGVAAIKGLAFADDKPCAPVSTLESLAYNLSGSDCIACAVMDARCNQVYNAMFDCSEDGIKRLTEDAAIKIDELPEILSNYDKQVVLVGDGASLCYEALKDRLPNIKLAPAHLSFQRASSVAFAAEKAKAVPASELLPLYLRMPQAERELQLRRGKK